MDVINEILAQNKLAAGVTCRTDGQLIPSNNIVPVIQPDIHHQTYGWVQTAIFKFLIAAV